MVALLMRLRWRVTRNNYSGNRLALYIVLGIVGFLAAIGSLSAGLINLERPGATADVIALVTTSWGVVWLFMPFIAGTIGGSLRPAQFALLPVSPRRFAGAFLITSFATLPVAFTLLGLGAPALYAARTSLGAAPLAVLAVVLQAVLVVGAARLVGVVLTELAATRRGRDLAMVLAVLLGAGLWLVYMAMQLIVPAVMEGTAPWLTIVLRANPFGWAAHATELAVTGSWLPALGMIGALLAVIAALAAAWTPIVTRQMRWPGTESSGGDRKGRRNGSAAKTPLEAAVRKEFALLMRDPRRKAAVLIVPMFLLLIFAGPAVMDGFDAYLSGASLIMALALVSGFLNLYGFDGPSLWQILVTPGGVGRDIRGKQVAWALFAAPVFVVVLAGRYILYDRGVEALPYDIATGVAALGVGSAAVVLSSVYAPYPVPSAKQGNPFSTRGSFNSASLISLFATVVAVGAVGGGFALLTAPGGAVAWLAVPVGVAVGWSAWALGQRYATRGLEARGPDILEVVRKEP